MSLKIILDHAQGRVQNRRIGVTVEGSEWISGYYVSSDFWLEKVTNTLQIGLHGGWLVSARGHYRRLELSDFDLTDGDDGWLFTE